MQNKCDTYIRSINSINKKYNILCCPTHESYETGLCQTGHNFYAMRAKGIKDWNTKYRPCPNNYVLLNGTDDQIQPNMVFDIVLSQNKFGQFQLLKPIADQLNIPFISLEHTLCVPNWGEDQRETCRKMTGDINVFIAMYSLKEWRFDPKDSRNHVIHHGIDTDLFKSIENSHNDGKILSVVNDWPNRDWCCNFSAYKRICLDNKMPINPLGDSPGFSKPASSTEDLIKNYQNASVFINTSTISPIPTALLEAAACECPIVSTNTCLIPEAFKDKVDGFFSNDESYLKEKLDWCLKNPEEAKQYGKQARKTILEKFALNKFIDNWNGIFNKAYGVCHYV